MIKAHRKSKPMPPLAKALWVLFGVIMAAAGVGACIFCTLVLAGHKGNIGQCKWELDETGTLVISGQGSTSGVADMTIGVTKISRDDILRVEIREGVTDIPAKAFDGCDFLQYVSIPSSVETIGDYAFTRCGNLAAIEVSPNNQNYCSIDGDLYDKNVTKLITYASGKEEVTEYTFPETVTSVGNEAFHSSIYLQTVNIGKDISDLGNFAFYDCWNLANVNLDPENAYYLSDENVLYNPNKTELIYYAPGNINTEFKVPGTVRVISNGAFCNAAYLENITLPSKLKRIGTAAFSGCSMLGSLQIPEECLHIGDGILAYCGNLASVSLPSGMDSIPRNMFWGCTSITDIDIPDGVTSIGDGAFACCRSLVSIDIPAEVISIGNNAFGFCDCLTSVDLPDGIDKIDDYAFSNCSGLTEIVIPANVASIGYASFRGCTGLTEVTVPDTVASIGDYAFYGCSNIRSFTIGSGVKSIGIGAFNGCTALSDVSLASGQAGWDKISVGKENEPLTAAVKSK